MLLGEHAVIYGFPCIVTAVDMRVQVTLEEISTENIFIETPMTRLKKEKIRIPLSELENLKPTNAISFVTATIKLFKRFYQISSGIDIKTFGPEKKYGLGSSSAITVAVAYGLCNLYGIHIDKHELFRLCHAAVMDVQGEASGFDVASAIFGGTIFYENRGEVITQIQTDSLPIIIGYSGKKMSTVNLVESVRQLYSRREKHIDKIFETIGDLVIDAREAIIETNWRNLGELININQGLLEALGVGSPNLATPIYAARDNGALGAKLSGAGGGDCMFALSEPRLLNAVEKAIRDSGTEVAQIENNSPGVRVENF